VSHVLLFINRSYFLVGAKIEYLFCLLQAKNKKITADYESLTFVVVKELFLSGVYYPVCCFHGAMIISCFTGYLDDEKKNPARRREGFFLLSATSCSVWR
jgi:hypothetical protein